MLCLALWLNFSLTSTCKFHVCHRSLFYFFFFNDTATTEIYTLSLHDALPICGARRPRRPRCPDRGDRQVLRRKARSEEHTSELQSRRDLVCRLLLEKKKRTRKKK